MRTIVFSARVSGWGILNVEEVISFVQVVNVFFNRCPFAGSFYGLGLDNTGFSSFGSDPF